MDPAARPWAKARKQAKSRLACAAIRMLRCLPAGLYRGAAEFGRSVEFSLWVAERFPGQAPFLATRQALWRRMLSCLDGQEQVIGLEFGVAYGHSTRWWLSHCKALTQWVGFDTFRGLPRPWGRFPAGAFDAGGRPPDVSDQRVEWVIGPVEETFDHRWLSAGPTSARRVFLFDLDLYEPTACVASQVFPNLRPGDLVYMDEAADQDERRVLAEQMERAPGALELIGATPMGLALRARPAGG